MEAQAATAIGEVEAGPEEAAEEAPEDAGVEEAPEEAPEDAGVEEAPEAPEDAGVEEAPEEAPEDAAEEVAGAEVVAGELEGSEEHMLTEGVL